jgi:hypothetical protein
MVQCMSYKRNHLLECNFQFSLVDQLISCSSHKVLFWWVLTMLSGVKRRKWLSSSLNFHLGICLPFSSYPLRLLTSPKILAWQDLTTRYKSCSWKCFCTIRGHSWGTCTFEIYQSSLLMSCRACCLCIISLDQLMVYWEFPSGCLILL